MEPRYYVAPTQDVAAVRLVDGERRFSMLHWSLSCITACPVSCAFAARPDGLCYRANIWEALHGVSNDPVNEGSATPPSLVPINESAGAPPKAVAATARSGAHKNMDDARFDFEAYHILLVSLGASLLVSYWIPHLILRRPPAATALLMACGMVVSLLFPSVVSGIDPTENPAIWEITAELVVIVVLFATGLRIDDLGGRRLWWPTVRLLAITMPLTIAAVALLGWSMAGMTVAGAILLGAVLAPTDPVLAGDLQIGPPLQGKEHPVRFALTTEAGLNDGLAFPFVYLALHVASQGANPATWLTEWLAWDVLYRIGVGTVLGVGIGWLLGRILTVPAWNTVAQSGPGVLVLAGVFLAYGVVELAEGYGFIAAFVAGLVCRRAEARHRFHQHLHSFASSVEHAVTAILLVLLGSVMPSLWQYLDWSLTIIVFGLILAIRPIAGMLGLLGTALSLRSRAVVAFYGVRGIGSLYYLGYASTHLEFIDDGRLWALVVFTIFTSTVIHGLTATATVEVLDREYGEGSGASGPPGAEGEKTV